jgi:hypothetical protein
MAVVPGYVNHSQMVENDHVGARRASAARLRAGVHLQYLAPGWSRPTELSVVTTQSDGEELEKVRIPEVTVARTAEDYEIRVLIAYGRFATIRIAPDRQA